MRRASISILAVVVALAALPALAVRVEPEFGRPAVERRVPRLSSSISFAEAPVLARLGRAVDEAPAQLERMAEWNRDRGIPRMTGFFRPLPNPLAERISRFTVLSTGRSPDARIESLPNGARLWHGRVTIASAKAIRIHMTGVDLPPRTRLWLRGASGTLGPIDPFAMLWNGEIFCPEVLGESAELIVEVPAGSDDARFTIDGAVEIFEPVGETSAPPQTASYKDCLINAECTTTSDFDAIALARGAVAEIQFISGSGAYICSGGLLADSISSKTPYFLTANHCISDQSSASTLVAYFDYRWNQCDSPPVLSAPSSRLTYTGGATLLATSAYTDTSGPASDFTLLRLNSDPPAGRTYLGFNSSSSALADGTKLYRVSHPAGKPQSFTTYTVDDPPDPNNVCPEVPPDRFIYETTTSGSTTGGSSGSPVMIAGGYVVGQLLGLCGDSNVDECIYSEYSEIDGRLSRSWQYMSQWLDPASCVAPTVGTSPSNATIDYGSRTTLQVALGSGSVPVTYQWYVGTKGDTSNPIRNASSSSYTTPNLTTTTSFWVRISNSCGHDDSATATVTVNPCVPPSVTTAPQSTTIDYGQSTKLRAAGSGSPTLIYHWYRGSTGDTSSPVGTISSSFTTPALTTTTSYWVRITNPCGSADSTTATVTVRPCDAPTITTQPSSQSTPYGSQARLTVSATGATPLTYQWYAGQSGDRSNPIANATTAALTTPSITSATPFWVLVTNPCRSLESATATVTPTCTDPTITSRNGAGSVLPGHGTTLSITVSGTSPFAVQWYADGTAIPSATQLGYTTLALQKTTIYTVVVTGPCGTTAATDFPVIVTRLHPVRRP